MESVDGLLLDIDGVLVVSWEPVQGAPEALRCIRADRLPVRFVTNTTSIPRSEIVQRLGRAGFEVAPEEVLTAPTATAAWIRSERPDARCLLVNSGDLGDDLEGVRWVGRGEDADVVVVGGAGPEFTYELVNHALRLLLEGAELVGMHRNRYWQTARGFSLDSGAYLAALEHAAEIEATIVGKPSPEFFATALAELGVEPGRAAMVGDDIESDVLGSQAVGIRGILVQTGKYRAEAVASAPGRADATISSFAALPDLLDP